MTHTQLELPFENAPTHTFETERGVSVYMRHRFFIDDTVAYGDWQVTRHSLNRFTVVNTRTGFAQTFSNRTKTLDTDLLEQVMQTIGVSQ